MSVYLGIDAGTQSVKVIAYDAAARAVLAQQARPLELSATADGGREQNAADWVNALVEAIQALPGPVRAQVRGLAVSGQQHGFVPLGRDNRALGPVKLWCDTSTSAECEDITATLGGAAACIAEAGNDLRVGYTASKLRWTRQHRPEVDAALDGIALPHDYLNLWLTGQRFMEAGDASGTGWLDVRRRDWSPAMLAATDERRDLAALLPPLVGPEQGYTLLPAVAALLGLPPGTRVAVGGGDNMMAAIGTGAVREGRLSMSLGTSGTLFAWSATPCVDAQGRWAAFCASDGGWLPLICTMNCTIATGQVAALLGQSPAQCEDLLAQSTPGADGLVMLPFFNGERSPDLPLARGALHGLDLHNLTPANLYRAAMEGASYSLRLGHDALVEGGLHGQRLVLTGGGANSPAWRQLIADLFQLPVVVPVQAEGAAFGAALQALWLCEGQGRALADLVDEHLKFDAALAAQPDPARAAAYEAGYQRFVHHLQALTPLFQQRLP
ncbi:xylulokinase [Stenotrophomonas sp.]|uniref:xylulokinase n=1 Tax=Stenotrophomonas sp. TaxID=69392 RepID=UPI0028A03A8E|nr:xylulokinase [Stenotrophomonas sp.]